MKLKLIVGLSNPGAQYAATRHNVGAWYVDLLARYYNQCLKIDSKFSGYSAQLNISGQDIYLLIPTTFMNLSGKATAAITNFYCIAPEEILVAHDDLDLRPGVAKFKLGGGHGGHNGLKDIISKLGNNQNFHRLRIGIGHPRNYSRVAEFVLSKPPTIERTLINCAVNEAANCTEVWMKDGLLKAMNRLHNYKAYVV